MAAVSSSQPRHVQNRQEIDSSSDQPSFILDYDVIRKYALECNVIIQTLAQMGLNENYCGPYAVLLSLRLMGEKPDPKEVTKSLAGKVSKINKSGCFVPELVSIISSLTKRKVFAKQLSCEQINQSLANRRPVIIFLPDTPINHFSTIVGSDQNNYYLLDYCEISALRKSMLGNEGFKYISFEE